MFIFAHVFLGALIGLGFWHLTHDRRILPLCVLGTLLPDLLDKPLAILFPEIMGSGRTIGHTLLLVGLLAATGIFLWYYRDTLAGLAFACAIFSHQILDTMWSLPSIWFYPLQGPFPVFIIPDYIGHYFWLEISSPSEWIFAGVTFIVTLLWYLPQPENRGIIMAEDRKTIAQILLASLLAVMGVSLLISGLIAIPGAFFAPTYDPVTDMMAGLLALSGAIILVKWPRSRPFSPSLANPDAAVTK